jgi:hypothetical protein
MNEQDLSVRNLHRFAGSVWLLIGGIILFIVGLFSHILIMIMGFLMIGGAIALFIVFGIKNSNVKSVLQRQHFTAQCTNCSQDFDYLGIQVLRHGRWPNGYIDCPRCRAHNGHTQANLTSIDPV